MQVQSLSINVPAGCLNSCRFCVAHMHRNAYTNQIEKNKRFTDLYRAQYKSRMAFARDNGCNTMMITGDGEPLLNHHFLENLAEWNDSLPNPFRWIELQTSGTLLDDEYLRFLRSTVRVSTISLSLSDIFSSQNNADYNRTKAGFAIDIDHLCSEIKRYDFILRLSLNLTDLYNDKTVHQIYARAQELGADQVTFRVLYESKQDTPEDIFVREHRACDRIVNEINTYIQEIGRPLQKLPFGAVKYSVNEISTVLDSNCMATEVTEALKYLILRPDCRLYSHWDTKGSLVF